MTIQAKNKNGDPVALASREVGGEHYSPVMLVDEDGADLLGRRSDVAADSATNQVTVRYDEPKSFKLYAAARQPQLLRGSRI